MEGGEGVPFEALSKTAPLLHTLFPLTISQRETDFMGAATAR